MKWKYAIDDQPPHKLSFLYALQFLSCNLIPCIVLPLVVAPYIGLDTEGLRLLTQSTFFFSGLATLLQVIFGHRYPLFEGPSALWVSAFVVLGTIAVQTGKSLELLRSELAFGLICAGGIYMLMARLKIMDRVTKLFSPSVMGTFFFLLVIQFSGTSIQHVLSITDSSPQINWYSAGAAFLTLATIFIISFKAKGFFRSISMLSGALLGWVIYLVMSKLGFVTHTFPNLHNLPPVEMIRLLPWGMPQFDPLVLLTSITINFIVLTNLLASVKGMGLLLDDPNLRLDQSVFFSGLANIMAGIGGTIGYVAQAQTIGFINLTRVASRLPFIIQAVMFMILALIPTVGAFFSSIPSPIGYAVFLAILTQIIAMGIKEFSRVEMNDRNIFIIGISLVSGSGLMFLPSEALSKLPAFLGGLLENGLIVGLILCIILDNTIKKSDEL